MKNDSHIVSVVIPTIGRSTVNLCKDALEKQTRSPDEVIIIKDHELRGVSWARNEGIRQARGDLIAFTDDDCVSPEDWLEQLIQAIDKHGAAGAGGTYKETDLLLDDIPIRKKFPEIEQVDISGLVGTGGNVMYKRAWLDALAEYDGYIFNESFKIAEDWELTWRLRILGAKLIFVPTRVKHLRQVTPFTYFCQQFNRGIGIAMLYRAQRSVNSRIAVHKSLIWDQTGTRKGAKWFLAFLYKAIGPFNMKTFKQMRNFWIFWIGEKFQGAGFIWGMISHPITRRKTKKE